MTEVLTVETAKARHAHANKIRRLERRGLSSAERQREFKAKMAAAGFVQINGWLHRDQVGDVRTLLDMLKADPDLTPGPARSRCTGKLVKLR